MPSFELPNSGAVGAIAVGFDVIEAQRLHEALRHERFFRRLTGHAAKSPNSSDCRGTNQSMSTVVPAKDGDRSYVF